MVALLFRFAVVQVRMTYWANQRTAMVAEGEYLYWLIHNVIATMHKMLMLFFIHCFAKHYYYNDYCIHECAF